MVQLRLARSQEQGRFLIRRPGAEQGPRAVGRVALHRRTSDAREGRRLSVRRRPPARPTKIARRGTKKRAIGGPNGVRMPLPGASPRNHRTPLLSLDPPRRIRPCIPVTASLRADATRSVYARRSLSRPRESCTSPDQLQGAIPRRSGPFLESEAGPAGAAIGAHDGEGARREAGAKVRCRRRCLKAFHSASLLFPKPLTGRDTIVR
jgi:hypothetical protein